MAKFLPVLGEIYTLVESAACVAVAGVAEVCGDTKTATKYLEAAGNAWTEYADGNLLVTPVRGIISDIQGDYAESNRLKETFGKAAGNFADGTPVVGHVKAVVHYSMGDTAKGNRSLEASTRTTAVLGAGVLTGGLGGGLLLGSTIGVTTGVAYDEVATVADIVVNGEKARPHGSLALLEANKMSPNEIVQASMGIAGDALAGVAGANLGRNIRAHLSKSPAQKTLVSTYAEYGVEEPRQAAKLTMEAAMEANEVKANVKGSCTTKVMDTTNGKSGVGHSGRIRNEIRAENYQERGFPSKTAARRATDYGTPSHLQETFSEVKPVIDRPQNACAEHAAFDSYYKNHADYSVDTTRTATVRNTGGGTFSSAERCGNCSEYGSAMGEVVTDQIPNDTPVPAEQYVAAGSTIGAYCGAYAAAASSKRTKSS